MPKLREEFLDEHRKGVAVPDAIHAASEVTLTPTADLDKVVPVVNKYSMPVLNERHNQYGSYKDATRIVQDLKHIARHTPKWESLEPDMQESIELIFTKMGRILNGNPNHKDSWHDIAGYANLIAERL